MALEFIVLMPINVQNQNMFVIFRFDDFFALCTDCRFDYVSTHYYGDSSCNVDWVMSHVRQVYKV